MPLIALLVAVVAIAAFTYVAVVTRSLLATGLALISLAWVLALCIDTSNPVHF